VKLLFENWRNYTNPQLLVERDTEADAKEDLKKASEALVRGYNFDQGQEPDFSVQPQARDFRKYLLDLIPDDLTDNQRAQSIRWLVKLARKSPPLAADFIKGNTSFGYGSVWPDLEMFFHNPQFMPQRDLVQIKSIEDLASMIDGARGEIRASQEKEVYKDLDKTEFFKGGFLLNKQGDKLYNFKIVKEAKFTSDRKMTKFLDDVIADSKGAALKTWQKQQGLENEEMQGISANRGRIQFEHDEGWVIAAVHNKDGACTLGAGTDWCTAIKDLGYFADYYQPDDPLFYFEHIENVAKVADYDLGPEEDEEDRYETTERFQFHYGSNQFMDIEDSPVSRGTFKRLHSLLKQAGAADKYEVINIVDLRMQAEDPNTPREVLDELVFHRDKIIQKAALNNDSVSEETIEKYVDILVSKIKETEAELAGWSRRRLVYDRGAVARELGELMKVLGRIQTQNSRGKLTSKSLLKISEVGNVMHRALVSRHLNSTPEVLVKMFERETGADPPPEFAGMTQIKNGFSLEVVGSIIKNPNAPQEIANKAANDGFIDELYRNGTGEGRNFERGIAMHGYFRRSIFSDVLSRKETPLEVLQYIYGSVKSKWQEFEDYFETPSVALILVGAPNMQEMGKELKRKYGSGEALRKEYATREELNRKIIPIVERHPNWVEGYDWRKEWVGNPKAAEELREIFARFL